MDEDEFVEAWLPDAEPWSLMDSVAIGFTLGHDLFGSVAAAFANFRNCAIAHGMYLNQQREFRQSAQLAIETLTASEVQDG